MNSAVPRQRTVPSTAATATPTTTTAPARPNPNTPARHPRAFPPTVPYSAPSKDPYSTPSYFLTPHTPLPLRQLPTSMWLYAGGRSHYVALFVAVLVVLLIFTLITSMPHPLDSPLTSSSPSSLSPSPLSSPSSSHSFHSSSSLHSALRQLIPLHPTPFPHPSLSSPHPPLYQRLNSSTLSTLLSHPTLHPTLHDTDMASHVDHSPHHSLVLLFHGCSHAGRDWWELPEDRRTLRLLLAMGYTTLAFTSADRSSGCWDTAWPLTAGGGGTARGGGGGAGNVDVDMVVAVLQAFIDATYPPHTTPTLFTLGASSGGVFASIVSRALPVMAQVIIIAPGSEPALLTVSERPPTPLLTTSPTFPPTLSPDALISLSTLHPVPPTLFLYMPGDLHWASTQRLTFLASRMREKGRALGFRLTREEAVVLMPTPAQVLTRGWLGERVDGVGRGESGEWYEEAVRDGFVDGKGRLLQDPRESGMARYLVEKMGGEEWRGRFRAVEEEMNVLWGVHEMTSDRMDEVVRWMERHRTGRAR